MLTVIEGGDAPCGATAAEVQNTSTTSESGSTESTRKGATGFCSRCRDNAVFEWDAEEGWQSTCCGRRAVGEVDERR